MQDLLSEKQLLFVKEANAKWNIAHGSVRTGKTVGTLWWFLYEAQNCPDSQIYMIGHTSETLYDNVIKLIFESPQFEIFRPFCSWSTGNRVLTFRDKTIKILGAKDEGAVRSIRGKTMSLLYCDEITLYPLSIIEILDQRLSCPWSKAVVTCNPTYPDHTIKQWVDKAEQGDPNYYAMHWTLEDNPYVPEDYKQRLASNKNGIFYKRDYLGLWCLAEGAIFDFFDTRLHVVPKPPEAADYWIAGIDFGMSNATACVLIGVYSGIRDQRGKKLWAEKEYYWDSKVQGRQKGVTELADDIKEFLEPYGPKGVYIDPSAAVLRLELQRRGMHVIDADNDVFNGIQKMTSLMSDGDFVVCKECKNLIREIQTYVWDEKKSKQGDDAPIKKADHLIDSTRYATFTHKIATYQPYKHNPQQYLNDRFKSNF